MSSGEVALFGTAFGGGALGVAEPLQVKAGEFYKGFVWNLWNARNYEGPFYTGSLSFGKTLGNAGVFWDAKNGFKGGAWGIGRTFATIRSGPNVLPCGEWSIAGSYVNYYKMFLHRKTPHPASIVTTIVLLTIACNAIETAARIFDGGAELLGLAAGGTMFETTMWIQTGVAKYYWGKKMPEYNYEERRKSSKRPPGFESGPGLFLYNWFY